MRRKIIIISLLLGFFVNLSYSQKKGAEATAPKKGIEVIAPKRGVAADIAINVDGKPFTSFITQVRGLDIGKPIFWPIRSAKGTIVTRGWPLVTDIPNEQNDHPHHTGLFITHGVVTAGTVKELNFWATRSRNEKERLIEVKNSKSGEDYGLLETVSLWESPETGPILENTQKNIFWYDNNSRMIDFDITLKGLKVPVTFEDTKEGAIGIRVHRDMTEEFGGAKYINAEGLETEKNIWGKRSKWVALSSKIGTEPIVIAIMFRPETNDYPPLWHARGYGCFAVNPFSGGNAYSEGKNPPTTTTIKPGGSIKLKYRVLIYSGQLTKQQLDQQYDKYLKQSESVK